MVTDRKWDIRSSTARTPMDGPRPRTSVAHVAGGGQLEAGGAVSVEAEHDDRNHACKAGEQCTCSGSCSLRRAACVLTAATRQVQGTQPPRRSPDTPSGEFAK